MYINTDIQIFWLDKFTLIYQNHFYSYPQKHINFSYGLYLLHLKEKVLYWEGAITK